MVNRLQLTARAEEMQQFNEQRYSMTAEDSPVGKLYRLHSPALFAFLRQHTASREDAEDVLLEVFIAALEDQELLALSVEKQLAWLWRVVRNKAIDRYRRNARRPVLALEYVEDQLYADEDLAPELQALRQDEYRRLRATLESLTPLQQEVLYLRFADDLRCSEVAQILGKNESSVRVQLMRTLKHLRTIYTKRQ
jgi:RNA polymerase sigma factor (sigma-70 family)